MTDSNETPMVNLYGADVLVDIPSEVFPTEEERKQLDELIPGGEHGWFESCFQKTKLHYRSWLPPNGQKVKGVLVWMHGITAHCMRGKFIGGRKLCMSLLVDSFVKKGYAVYSFSMYGHGFSEGKRWLIPETWENNKQDLINFCNMVADKHPKEIPFFISGESYGGNLTVHVAKEFQEHPEKGPSNFDSFLLAAPAIIGDLPGFPVYHILRYVMAPMFPERTPFFMPNTLPPERLWRDEEVLKHSISKRNMEMQLEGAGRKFRLGTAVNMVLALEEVRDRAIPSLKVPFCIVHGTDDFGVPIAGSEFLMENSATPEDQKEFHPIQGGYHDIWADPQAEEGMEAFTRFVEKRTAAFSAKK